METVVIAPSPSEDPLRKLLGSLLTERFRLSAFRPHQERVCSAVAAGDDALVVMPTGAGKSLCYQLPALARGGTALVVSPLIALMEDQVAKLRALGLRAACIHSGRDRADSRASCRAYLDGALDYLFIAPERLRVPRFPEMLEKQPLALVAVDEAHCISHWGHDFRPEYRLLGERIARFRPAPVVALTATATPRVQADIVEQLSIAKAHRFVSGFRRDNLHVEVAEVPRTRRSETARRLLEDPGRRPAIVYVPTRKDSEAIAEELGPIAKTASYHAGMSSERRDTAQRAFLRGEVEIVVATIAFGMGIDKADVRTVVHTAMPSSIEGYYQEIGRAGRDGQVSHAVLLHSFADQRLLLYLHDKSYPDPASLERAQEVLGAEPLALSEIQTSVDMESEEVERSIEHLWLHGGARSIGADSFVRGETDWRPSYAAQRDHHEQQIRLIARYAETPMCRMSQLTRHFGDPTEACGRCDVCAPSDCLLVSDREPTERERALAARVEGHVRREPGATMGQVARAMDDVPRSDVDEMIGALARSGTLRLEPDSFEKDGKRIDFFRCWPEAGAGTFRLPAKLERARASRGPASKDQRRERRKARKEQHDELVRETPGLSERIDRLRAWRKREAEEGGFPAFRVFSDTVMVAIASLDPGSIDELGGVRGIGAQTLKRYGGQILAALRG